MQIVSQCVGYVFSLLTHLAEGPMSLHYGDGNLSLHSSQELRRLLQYRWDCSEM